MQTVFLLLAIGVHLLLLYSIFDIYYSSPIVHGARSFPIVSSNSSAQAPADRLVFFSADGLRARTFYAHPERSPFLHSLIHGGKAAWGISNSHVPTESRPGHVAMVAGFYEDVSAVTRGWKHNPVPFDSTFNQSARAFLWGSPDIVHLFSTNIGPHARAEVYATELEDFASKDAAQLDRWVFQRVEKFLNRGKQEPEVGRQLATKRAIFFLHLLGLDTNGHGKKPRSEAYLANIGTVDDGVRQITRLFGQHFGDNRTAFLFTADHGMTDWGSHGDGTDDEVETPFMAWGAGISDSSATAQLRLTLAQVDLAPLQAALLGIAIPTNSFGIVPIQLLGATSHRYRFQAAYANFKQMVEQLAIRRAERRAHSFRVFFSEFPTLHFDALVNIENEILRLAQLKRYEAAGKACLKWIPLVREALNYFHGYHRFSQGLAIGALFCAWNFVLYASLIGHYQHLSALKIYGPSPPFCIGLFLAAVLVWAQGLTIANYLYFLSSILLLSIGLNMLGIDSQKLGCTTRLLGSTPLGIRAKRVAAALIFTGLAISLLVCVFFERYILSLLFVVISPVWIIQLWQRQNSSKNNDVQWGLGWLLLCLALATFPLMDTVGSVPRPLLVICAQALCCCALFFWTNRRQMPNAKMELTGFRVVRILHWVGLVLLVADVLMGPLQLMRIFAWLSLPLAFMIPFLPPTFFPTQSQNANNNNQLQRLVNQRLLLWSASLQLPYSLLSLGQECLFLCLFSALLFVYVQLDTDDILHDEEASFANKKKRNHLIRNFAFDEWLNALFLVICIEMAFFGTGNIASLNSFNPSFLRHFLSVFSPFTMAALLLLKVFIPFLLVSLHFVAASTGSRSQGGGGGGQARLARLSTLVAMITNWMAMAFFYCLRTDGSWLQIGLSISNYVICLVCSAATHLLLHFAHCLLFLPDDTTKSQIIIRKSLALFDSYF